MIDISSEIESRLKARPEAEGVSVGASVERLVSEEDARRVQLSAFEQAINERLAGLNDGTKVDGEEVMSPLIAELDEPARARRSG